MAGSLLFAGYHHFVLHGPDHILEAPHGAWLPVFQVTAVLLLVLEAFGCWFTSGYCAAWTTDVRMVTERARSTHDQEK